MAPVTKVYVGMPGPAGKDGNLVQAEAIVRIDPGVAGSNGQVPGIVAGAPDWVGPGLPDHVLTTVSTASGTDLRWQRQAPHLLSWGPPLLDNPAIIDVTAGQTDVNLTPHITDASTPRDFIINLPATARTAYLQVYSFDQTLKARHIVIIGGMLTSHNPSYSFLQVNDFVGTLHIEGVLFDDAASAPLVDRIYVNPNTGYAGSAFSGTTPTVQLQNCRAMNIQGNDSNHNDFIQTHSNVHVRADRVTLETNGQGFFLKPTTSAGNPPTGDVDLRRVNIHWNTRTDDAVPSSFAQPLWLIGDAGEFPSRVNLDEVYIEPRSGQTLANTVEPSPTSTFTTDSRSTYADGMLSWPDLAFVTGQVQEGDAPADFAPDGDPEVNIGVPGIGYISPGYLYGER